MSSQSSSSCKVSGAEHLKSENDFSPECRICQCGPEEGILISPCKCKGSMKYVHRTCLEQWRVSSPNRKSFFQCDQCLYRYSFQRTWLASVLRHWAVHFLVTVILLLFLAFLAGFLLKFILFCVSSEFRESLESSWDVFLVNFNHFFIGLIGISVIGFLSALPLIPGRLPDFRGTGGGRRDDNTCCQILIAIALLVGLIKSLIEMWQIVDRYISSSLSNLEEHVENVE